MSYKPCSIWFWGAVTLILQEILEKKRRRKKKQKDKAKEMSDAFNALKDGKIT